MRLWHHGNKRKELGDGRVASSSTPFYLTCLCLREPCTYKSALTDLRSRLCLLEMLSTTGQTEATVGQL